MGKDITKQSATVAYVLVLVSTRK